MWHTQAVAAVTRDAGAGRLKLKPGAREVAEQLGALAGCAFRGAELEFGSQHLHNCFTIIRNSNSRESEVTV